MLPFQSSILGDRKEKNGVKVIEQKRKEKGSPGIWKPVDLL